MSVKIRVAIIAASLKYVGGQSVQADLLLRNWKGDSDVEAKLIPIDPPFPAVLAWAEKIPGLRTIIREPLYLLGVWRGLKDADIVHIFSAAYWSFLIAPAPAWLVARLREKKSLIHYHSGEARDHLKRFASARWVLKKVDATVVPSNYLADVFGEFDLPTEVVANVVDLEQFAFRERHPLRPHLVCTRGFHSYYCVDIVVRAFAEVKKLYPEAQLDLVGKGELEGDIRQLVQDLHLEGVNFAGVATRQDIGGYYDRADIFINASRLDNMPVSVMEAFAAGTPVVTTSPECMPYLVEHEKTGLLSPVGDPVALAANVIRLLQNPDLAFHLAQNAHLASLEYRWEDVRKRWLEVYRQVLRDSKE